MSRDLTPQNWNDLQDLLFRDTWDDNLQRYRSPFVYRGLSDSKYQLITSLMRLEGVYPILERHLLRTFKKNNSRNNFDSRIAMGSL